ncbi:MAG: translation initiation factor IF-6 [Candidatus Micrarchaeota archaeon]|nr:translation initiation factor IF-6 [Candidatus Micrarchaeota archaeon]
MVDKSQKIGFYGNPYIGLFIKSNSSITLMPVNKPEKFSRVCEILGTKAINCSVFESPLVGLYSIMNDSGILFSKLILEEELEIIKKRIKEEGFDINVDVLDSEFTALANNVVVNNKHCLINPKMNEKKITGKIKDILNVDVTPLHLQRFNVIGSIIFTNDNGYVAHPNLTGEELDEIEKHLGIKGGVGTANGGIPFVSLCLVGNNKSIIFGENTTAFEQQRIIDALGFNY